MSLLSKAKSYTPKRAGRVAPNNEEVEIAVAWAKGEVTSSQVAHAYGKNSVGNKILNSLREYVRNIEE